jgi:Lrp/AsnC family leucine-responsive transcriptional regulator
VKSAIHSNLGHADRRILETVRLDGRISITDLAEKIGLAKTPAQLRLKRWVENATIEGFRAVLSPQKLGLEHVAFVQVKLSDTREDALQKSNSAVNKRRTLEQCHMIAGAFDYLLKGRSSDIKAHRQILGDKILSLPDVASTSTVVAMQSAKEN